MEDHPWPMQVFEAPKRDKNGKIINEEDAEARQAARELRRQREEALRAAQQAGLEAARAGSDPVQSPPKKKRRRNKKGSPAPETVTLRPASPATEETEGPSDHLPAPPSAPRRGVRSGALIDTGDAMPNTEFHRPNPLDSDTIMDATARLLAPRRSLLSSLLPRPAEKSQNQGKKKQSGPQKAKQVKAEESKKARQ